MTDKEALEFFLNFKSLLELNSEKEILENEYWKAAKCAIAALEFQIEHQENKDNTARSGKWITSTDGVGNLCYACSNCNASWWEDKTEDRYCSNCGAKMVDMR